jgi:transcription elongation factor GreB
MSKAFVKDDSAAGDDDEDIELPELPAGVRNYITPAGYGRLREELAHLV